jgi:glycerol-3-phosphate dehydrogenase
MPDASTSMGTTLASAVSKGLPGAEVAWVLQQDRFADIHQQLCTQKKRLARTAQHQDLVGRAFGAALKVQIRRDGFA